MRVAKFCSAFCSIYCSSFLSPVPPTRTHFDGSLQPSRNVFACAHYGLVHYHMFLSRSTNIILNGMCYRWSVFVKCSPGQGGMYGTSCQGMSSKPLHDVGKKLVLDHPCCDKHFRRMSAALQKDAGPPTLQTLLVPADQWPTKGEPCHTCPRHTIRRSSLAGTLVSDRIPQL